MSKIFKNELNTNLLKVGDKIKLNKVNHIKRGLKEDEIEPMKSYINNGLLTVKELRYATEDNYKDYKNEWTIQVDEMPFWLGRDEITIIERDGLRIGDKVKLDARNLSLDKVSIDNLIWVSEHEEYNFNRKHYISDFLDTNTIPNLNTIYEVVDFTNKPLYGIMQDKYNTNLPYEVIIYDSHRNVYYIVKPSAIYTPRVTPKSSFIDRMSHSLRESECLSDLGVDRLKLIKQIDTSEDGYKDKLLELDFAIYMYDTIKPFVWVYEREKHPIIDPSDVEEEEKYHKFILDFNEILSGVASYFCMFEIRDNMSKTDKKLLELKKRWTNAKELFIKRIGTF